MSSSMLDKINTSLATPRTGGGGTANFTQYAPGSAAWKAQQIASGNRGAVMAPQAPRVDINALIAGQKAAGPAPMDGAIYDPSVRQWFLQTPDPNTNTTAIQWLGGGGPGLGGDTGAGAGGGGGYGGGYGGGSAGAASGGPKVPPYMQPPPGWMNQLPGMQGPVAPMYGGPPAAMNFGIGAFRTPDDLGLLRGL